MSLAEIQTWCTAHPIQAILGALLALVTVVLGRLAQIELTPEEARARPRYASAVVFARFGFPVVRGMLKAISGIFLPKAAAELVEKFFPDDGSAAPVAPISNPGGKS